MHATLVVHNVLTINILMSVNDSFTMVVIKKMLQTQMYAL